MWGLSPVLSGSHRLMANFLIRGAAAAAVWPSAGLRAGPTEGCGGKTETAAAIGAPAEDSWASLGLKELPPVHPRGDQSWVFIGRADAEAATPTLWPPHGKSWLTGKDPDAGKDWRQEEKGTTEDEMAGHHRLSGHGFEQALREWRTGKPGMLPCLGSQSAGTELPYLKNNKNQMILTVDVKKALDKNPAPTHDKTSQQTTLI